MTTSEQLQPVLIAGAWRAAEAPAGAFSACDPSTRAVLPDVFPVSSAADVARALAAGSEAAAALRDTAPETIAAFLDDFAARLEANVEALVDCAARETALPPRPRLREVELPRTTNQLRQGASAARERSWCRATIDTKVNIRSCFEALGGPVVVFGPNNFPFAFNAVSGGDFVAAIAAGNPVIAKAHPSHPATTRLLATCAHEAARAAGLPPATVQMLYHLAPDVGLDLVAAPAVGAVAFTGSRASGLKLKAAADRAGKPIYLELSSVNPVFVLPGAMDERGSAIAKDLAASATMAAGQFCTSPGLTVLVDGERGHAFVGELGAAFAAAPAGTLLGPGIAAGLTSSMATLTAHGAAIVTGGHVIEGARCAFENTLLSVSGDAFLADAEALQTEAFGAANLVVLARDEAQITAVAARLEGNLTGSIYSDTRGSDDVAYATLAAALRPKVGRLLNDKMPTGVAVSPAMTHGGPYPATGHPGFTAVGIPASLTRFAALRCYDNVRAHRLPPVLRDANPTGQTWRLLDGAWSQRDVGG